MKFNIKEPLDCIIHCAIDQNYLNKNDNEYSRINLGIIKNITNFAKKNNSKLIINFSSIEVYGEIKVRFYRKNVDQ